jgi:hypothetical protein
MTPQQVTVQVGDTATAIATLTFPPAVVPWTFDSQNDSVASADGIIQPGESSTPIRIRGISPGEVAILCLVPNLGRAPTIVHVGSVTVTNRPPNDDRCEAPAITRPPGNQQILAGQSATIGVRHTGTAPFIYRWVGQEAGGPTTSLSDGFTNPFVTHPLHITTTFWVTIRNHCGTVTSTPARVTVLPTRTRSVRH